MSVQIYRAAGAVIAALVTCGAGGAVAAEAAPAPVLVGPSGSPVTLSADLLAGLPMTKLNVSFETEHGVRKASFEGPLLWDVLVRTRLLDGKPRDTAREVVAVTGTDGYVAALAVGEISPEFEGKAVILAESMDGKPLDLGHLRMVVPLDHRGGRSVREVARIAVVDVQPPRK